MATYRRPGTYIEEVTLAQNVESQGLDVALGAFVGMALRGPASTPVYVSNWTDFTKRFGQFRSADGTKNFRLAQAIYSFFADGGRGAWVVRLVGAGAAKAETSFNDSGAQPVLTVKALDEGDWALNNLYAQISNVVPSGAGGASADGDTFTLSIFNGGIGQAYIVESWSDLTLRPGDSRYALDVVNGNSSWVSLVRPAATGFLPPVTNDVPVALAKPSGVTGSLDGTADPTVQAYKDAASVFDITPSNLIFNVPDAYDMVDGDAVAIANEFILKADSRGDSFVVVDVPKGAGATAAGALTWATGLTGSGNAAAYFPAVKIINPVSGGGGGLVTVPPGGAVVGTYHATDSSRGVFKSPAGTGASLPNVVDVAVLMSPATLDSINTAVKPLNAIKPVPGAGICIMGARTLAGTRDLRYVAARRTMLAIKKALVEATQFAVMENNDYRLWEQVRTVCVAYLSGLWQAGGLKGGSMSEAFFVKCDATNNTSASIDAGVLNIEVGVALQSPAEFVVIRIGQFDGGVSVSEQA